MRWQCRNANYLTSPHPKRVELRKTEYDELELRNLRKIGRFARDRITIPPVSESLCGQHGFHPALSNTSNDKNVS